ncbi:hypothetical protein [Methylobacterium sp. Leaf117]|uniref:hypothetical protein n=1 Tax=Methylobacterium sp. Leaf117 TaxID=1736260 RepID=UPI0012E287CB|nr:hypothetical protein [Methylobacterium sp. Leaf117]
MGFLSFAAILGGGLTVAVTWPIIGLWSLLAAPFGASFFTLGAVLVIERPAEAASRQKAKAGETEAGLGKPSDARGPREIMSAETKASSR